MVRVRGQLDAPLLDVGAVREDYWERKEILLPSLSRLFKPKGWRRFFYKTQAPKIVLKRLTSTDWEKIDEKTQAFKTQVENDVKKHTPIIQKYNTGKKLTDKEYRKINEFGIKMRPVTYTMLQFIIDEPNMSYEEVSMMMEVLDDFDCDTLLSYVSIMTSEKASVMKRIYDKRMEEGIITA